MKTGNLTLENVEEIENCISDIKMNIEEVASFMSHRYHIIITDEMKVDAFRSVFHIFGYENFTEKGRCILVPLISQSMLTSALEQGQILQINLKAVPLAGKLWG